MLEPRLPAKRLRKFKCGSWVVGHLFSDDTHPSIACDVLVIARGEIEQKSVPKKHVSVKVKFSAPIGRMILDDGESAF